MKKRQVPGGTEKMEGQEELQTEKIKQEGGRRGGRLECMIRQVGGGTKKVG